VDGFSPQRLELALVQVATAKRFQRYCSKIVAERLGNYLSSGEYNAVAEDALGHVTEWFLIKIRSKPEFAVGFFTDGADEKEAAADPIAIEKYLSKAVRYYCMTRAYRWSSTGSPKDLQSPDEEEDFSEFEADDEEEKAQEKKPTKQRKPGARARRTLPADEVDDERFWHDVYEDARFKHESGVYAEKLADIFDSGALTERERHYFADRVNGLTYPEIAERDGDSEDKYRKIVTRAIAKLKKRIA
jgi:hypothetical protein